MGRHWQLLSRHFTFVRRCKQNAITSLTTHRALFSSGSEALAATLLANAGSIMMFAMYAGVKMTVLLWSLLVYGRSVF